MRRFGAAIAATTLLGLTSCTPKPTSTPQFAPDEPRLALISDWPWECDDYGDSPDFLLYRSGRVVIPSRERGAPFQTVVLTETEMAGLLDSLHLPSALDSVSAYHNAAPNVSDAPLHTLVYWQNSEPRFVRFRGGLWSTAYDRRRMPSLYLRWYDALENFSHANAVPWTPPRKGEFPGQERWEGRASRRPEPRPCPVLSAEEEATLQRLEAEDSIVRATPSPIAGTWRFVIRLPAAESVVVYSRTERYPMSPFRAWRRDDVLSDTLLPITGYHLMAVCAMTEEQLPIAYGAHRGSTCYHSASTSPVAVSPDSVTYRGDPWATLAAWIMLRDQPVAAQLGDALDEEARDENAYFMPGYWTTSPDGHARFSWDVRRADSLLASIRGDRISPEVLTGHSR